MSCKESDFDQTLVYFFIAMFFLAVGLSRLLWGILQRKREKLNLTDLENNKS